MESTQGKTPNLLVIFDDQHRFDYLGCAGADWVRTPNLDQLAARGVRFTNCFSNSPVCAPARIALASGLQVHRVGALSNNAFLPNRIPTYYQRLREGGYQVGVVGKLDLAKPYTFNGRHGDRPLCYQWGFTHPVEIEGKMHAGKSPTPMGPYGDDLQAKGWYDQFHGDYRYRAQHSSTLTCHDSVLPTELFADTWIGQRSVKWIEQLSGDFPWHLFVSFVGPHNVYDPPTEYADRYRDAPMPPAVRASEEVGPRPARRVRQRITGLTDEKILETRRQYCAAIEAIDDAIGRILAAVETRGWLENTVVMFASDHGDMLGDHDRYTKGVAYEPSLHVPLIAAGPGIARGAISNAMVELIDVGATCCDLAGVGEMPQVDARSFRPVLASPQRAHREDAFSCMQSYRCLRTSQWKLIANTNECDELYNVQEDPGERYNVADTYPDVVSQMSRRLRERWTEGGVNR